MLRKLWDRIRRSKQELIPSSHTSLELEHGAATHIGGREVNADHFTVRAGKKLFIVADGVGDKSGKLASRYTCRHVTRSFDTANPNTLLQAALQAHKKLQADQYKFEGLDGCLVGGLITTMSALHFGQNNTGHIVHAGDSSIYRLREGKLKRLTTPLHPHTQAIGGHSEKKPPETKTTDVKKGDVFLLCTDGVTGNEPVSRILSDEQIKQALLKTASGRLTPKETAEYLAKHRLTAFSDSRTAIVVKVRK